MGVDCRAMLVVAVDAMGGDRAPDNPVAGAARVSLDVHAPLVVLVGDAHLIQAQLRQRRHNPARLTVVHAPHAVPMNADPRAELSAHPDASIAVAARLVAEGRAGALVSAGNTGAVILACARHWQRLPGVRRCALAAMVPTRQRRGSHADPFSLVLDVGATVEADGEDLVTFAIMGSAYASRIQGNPAPRVALLSNGAEPLKGRSQVVEAHRLLREHPLLHFVGNVEGVDLLKGHADVVVTDGFTGNVVLKMLEGVRDTALDLGRHASRSHLLWRLGLMLLSGGLRQLRAATDWQQLGGAPILGFDHVCIKAHGRSSPRAMANAIQVAGAAVSTNLTGVIREGLDRAVGIPPISA